MRPSNRRESTGEAASRSAAADKEAPATNPVVDAVPETGERVSDPVAVARPASPAATDVVVQVTLIRGGITNLRVPVVICPRYDGLPLAGATKAFDRLLDTWLTRAVDLGMIGSGLGQLFPINLQRRQAIGKVNAGSLLLVSMGEPGRFARDDLRFLVSNIVVAVKGMGHDQFATGLIGTRRRELTAGEAVRGLIDGILDGYERFRAIVDEVTEDQERFQQAAARPLYLIVVDAEEERLKQIWDAFETVRSEQAELKLKLEVVRGPEIPPDPAIDGGAVDSQPDAPVNFLRVTRKRPALTTPRAGTLAADIFQFSALSEQAAVPIREQEINSYLIRELPERMTSTSSAAEREDFGALFANCVIPEAFQQLTEGSNNLTVEVDESTAAYPWEMAAHRKYARTSFVGTSAGVSRQFRSLLSAPPTSPPTLNRSLRVLVIADPAPGRLSLPQARAEGKAVVELLDRAARAWRSQYDIKATVRIGPHENDDDAELEELRHGNSVVESVGRCDPLALAVLIVNQQFDVIHYAGHGLFDKQTGRAGWVLREDCFLSASEIFRVRQVPRLVFANACFSVVLPDHNSQREKLAGLAQAFFARGIPNFIGTGWQVDDACAQQCARWFYARVLGLRNPDDPDAAVDTSAPTTIGAALREARSKTLAFKRESSSWGAYQHYGRVSDRLLAPPNASPAAITSSAVPLPDTSKSADVSLLSFHSGGVSMSPAAPAGQPTAIDPNLVYVNGIDAETGQYAFPPRSIDALAKQVLVRSGVGAFSELHADIPRSFGVPFGMEPTNLKQAGWAVVFHEDTPQDIRAALDPLLKLRERQCADRFKVLDYMPREQTRDWYRRHRMSAGNIDPEIVPYYLLLIGPPDLIPFDFQYLVGVEYAVGRLSFDTAAEYESYARSIVAYEAARAIPNAKQIDYWGTRHLGDPATNLSASLLIDPLANGLAGATGALKRPIHADVGYDRVLNLGDDATKGSLAAALHAAKPPAMLFTASHGMAVPSGRPNQLAVQGALLCQDWPGFGSIRPEHFLAAADVPDDANVNGMVALLFACFGNGTPDADQFPMDLAQAGTTPPLAPKPFIATLPRRLLAHPKGSALAVIGHIDRAWSFSIQAAKAADAQIGTFRNSLGFILSGTPVGHAMCGQFGARFAALSTALASATSPVAPASMHLSDRDLVTYWLERNDAQNYMLLGDPAVRIRTDAFS
jgi:hypothetical protein